MALVFITTIIFGALMPYAVRWFRSFDPVPVKVESLVVKELDTTSHKEEEHESPIYKFEFLHPNFFKQYA